MVMLFINTHCPESQDGDVVYKYSLPRVKMVMLFINTHCPESQDGDVVYKYSLPRESRW